MSRLTGKERAAARRNLKSYDPGFVRRDRQGRIINDEVLGDTSTGNIIRAFGTEYNLSDPAQKAAYEREQEAELNIQPPMADIRGGGGIKGYENGELMRFASPEKFEPAPKPGLDRDDELSREIDQSALNEMATRLAGEGIQFRHGFNSNTLPGYTIGTAAGMDGNLVENSQGGISSKGLEVLINANNVSNPQTGVSSIPDEVDSARAVPIPHSRSRNNRDGLGVDERFAEGADYGNPPKSAISDRSRAFLDYEGGSLGALRAAEASQDYMRQGGRNYAITGKDAEGNYTFEEFKDPGRKALVKDGNSTINHEFMDTYAMGDRPTPDQAQSPVIGFTTKADLETINSLRETPVAFGVGDGSAEQLIDFPNNFEKMVLDPADWMSRYREGLR